MFSLNNTEEKKLEKQNFMQSKHLLFLTNFQFNATIRCVNEKSSL